MTPARLRELAGRLADLAIILEDEGRPGQAAHCRDADLALSALAECDAGLLDAILKLGNTDRVLRGVRKRYGLKG